MASILAVSCGLPSVVYSSLELARRLAAAGHHLTFASLPPARTLVEHHRLDFLSLRPSGYERFLESDSHAGTLDRLLNLHHRRERARDSLAIDEFFVAVREMDPDLVLMNGEMHEHIIAAWATGARLVLLNCFVSIWRRPGLPPPHHLVRPGVGWRGTRAGISLLWLALRLRKYRTAWTLRARRIGCDRLSILQLLARDVGFDLRHAVDESQWLIPFTYRRLPVLSLHAQEFEFPHSPPEWVHYVGPMVLDSRIDRSLIRKDREQLDAIFERRRRSRGKRKLIYAGFGSMFSTDLDLLQRLIRAVAERPNWDLVMSLSDRIPPADLGRLPERASPFSWVPQMSVLRHADVAVTHGGINTIDECVISGVPMLIYCGYQTDMAGNTARVVHHGIGIAGDRRDSSRDMREHIDRLLQEPQFATNLSRLRQRYAAYVDNHVAERVVESLLESRDA